MNRHVKLFILLLSMLCAVSLCAIAVFATETGESDNPRPTSLYIITNAGCKTQYVAGEYFDPTGFRGIVSLSNGKSYIVETAELEYLQTAPLTANDTFVTFTYQGLEHKVDIQVSGPAVTGIELTCSVSEFLALEKLEAADFAVNLLYSDGTFSPIDTGLCDFYPSLDEPISSYTKMISVSYASGAINYSDSLEVNVLPILAFDLEGIDTACLYEAAAPEAPEGLRVIAYYDEARTVSQVITDYEISYGSALVKADDNGKTRLTLILDNQSVEAEVNVLPIVGYRITGFESAYYYGDLFTYANANVLAVYSDETTADVTAQVIFEAPDIILANSKVTFTHNGYDLKEFLPFLLPEGTIMIVTPPAKLKYEIGESFDSTGLSVGIAYSDGERRMLAESDYTLLVSDPLSAADKVVSINYLGASANLSISVGNEVYITALNLIGAPDVMEYYEGSLINTSGLNIEAYLSDGTKMLVSPQNLTFYPSLDTPLTVDVTSVKISANEGTDQYCEISFPITVKDKHPIALVPISMPNKLVYAEGEIFDPDGLALALYFNDGTSITPSTFTFSPELGSTIILHTNATEKCLVYAICEYEGEQYKYAIEITVNPAEVENIFISRYPVKTVYEIGEAFDPAGMELLLIYKDRSLMYQIIPEGYYTYSPTVITETTAEIVFSFRGYSVSLPITVNGVDSSDVTTEPIDPPVSDTEPIPPETSDVTTEDIDVTTEDVTTEDPEPTTEPVDTSEPEISTDEITTAPPEDITAEGDGTTEDTTNDKDSGPSSLLFLWIIVIVIIIAALIALIIYYKKNFT